MYACTNITFFAGLAQMFIHTLNMPTHVSCGLGAVGVNSPIFLTQGVNVTYCTLT